GWTAARPFSCVSRVFAMLRSKPYSPLQKKLFSPVMLSSPSTLIFLPSLSLHDALPISSRVAPRPHRAQGGDLGGVSGTSGDARVLVCARRPHGEPHQLRHDHARRLDAPDPPGLARDDADPACPRRLVADHAAAAPGALRVL